MNRSASKCFQDKCVQAPGVGPVGKVLKTPPLGKMEAPATPPASTTAGPSQPWPLAERRGRKSGSSHIFRGVSLQQLRGLFRTAGDQHAERRAELVWGQGDAAKLAQALIGLRTQRRRSRLRAEVAGEAPGPAWLTEFGHLRINEGVLSSPNEDSIVERETEDRTDLQGAAESQGETATADHPASSERPQATPKGRLWGGAGPRKQGGERNSERYLHRILH
ncbi:arginine vasopressin-induced protein 1-like isoform X2 [Anguilla rostrata]